MVCLYLGLVDINRLTFFFQGYNHRKAACLAIFTAMGKETIGVTASADLSIFDVVAL
jgi:hypothetical protein